MSISVLNRKILWGRSGNRCSFPGCNLELDIASEGKHTVIGEECHIEAQSPGGPRYNPDLSDVDGHENLILLCPSHHKIIDSNPEEYTVEKLKKMKADHENRVSGLLSSDRKHIDSNMFYESVVSYIEMMLEFDNWENWTSFVLSADYPTLSEEMAGSIEEIRKDIFSRVWPKSNLKFEETLWNYFQLLSDFSLVFNEHSENKNGYLRVEKYYHIKPYDWKLADKLLEDYKAYTKLIRNLILELTRMSNLLCDLTREYIDPMYRVAEGKLLITTGPFGEGDFVTVAPEYKPEERKNRPYPGLDKYKNVMDTRDFHL